jgi:hypothetical protein
MKYIKSILISLSILLSISNAAFAVNKCPGQTAKVRWSSANCSAEFDPRSSVQQCKFDEATPNSSGEKNISAGNTLGEFCTATLSCKGNQGTTASSEARLDVVDGPQCCSLPGTALTEGRNIWRKVSTKYPVAKCYQYTPPVITATTTPTATAPTVKWDCESPATSYNIVRTPAWASAPAWDSGTTTSTTTGLEGTAYIGVGLIGMSLI